MNRVLGLAVAALVVLGGCGKGSSESPEAVPGVVSRDATAAVKSGRIGAENPRDATYVFVDVENGSQQDRLIAIEGTLLDGAGQDLGVPVVGGELRVPAGGTRAFALIADRTVEGARAVRTRVHHATVADYPESVTVTGARLDAVGEFQVATARIENATDKDAMASVMAAFYAADGKVLARPFVVLAIPAKGSRPVRFEGPKTSTRGVVFMGDVTY